MVVATAARELWQRRSARLAQARNDERLELARELHDTVAHHVTAIVVAAQAGVVVAGSPPGGGRPGPGGDRAGRCRGPRRHAPHGRRTALGRRGRHRGRGRAHPRTRPRRHRGRRRPLRPRRRPGPAGDRTRGADGPARPGRRGSWWSRRSTWTSTSTVRCARAPAGSC
ncbi:histidine kinase [Pseudonocardia sp. ICBG601]|uniref:histidine kinase n=1 Tax=Pseudonocardia sp. ICBG601 TaxID=2846759 RepID=UPI001CF63217|nr:histidine kinase [Pseudonocardia sp. ICBG601]